MNTLSSIRKSVKNLIDILAAEDQQKDSFDDEFFMEMDRLEESELIENIYCGYEVAANLDILLTHYFGEYIFGGWSITDDVVYTTDSFYGEHYVKDRALLTAVLRARLDQVEELLLENDCNDEDHKHYSLEASVQQTKQSFIAGYHAAVETLISIAKQQRDLALDSRTAYAYDNLITKAQQQKTQAFF